MSALSFDPIHHKPPATYPIAFHEWVRLGYSGLTPYADFKWTPASTKARFRLFIRTLRLTPTHALHEQARDRQWHWDENQALAGYFSLYSSRRTKLLK